MKAGLVASLPTAGLGSQGGSGASAYSGAGVIGLCGAWGVSSRYQGLSGFCWKSSMKSMARSLWKSVTYWEPASTEWPSTVQWVSV